MTGTRDSVANGDDDAAPHSWERELPDAPTVGDVVRAFRTHTASIGGGRATWVLCTGRWERYKLDEATRRPLAVVAQQWDEPVLLEDASTPLGPTDTAVHLEYLTQRDPAVVLAELRRGEWPRRRDPA